MNRALERIPKILRINYFSCFPEPFSVSVQVSFSRGWKGRRIWSIDQANKTAGTVERDFCWYFQWGSSVCRCALALQWHRQRSPHTTCHHLCSNKRHHRKTTHGKQTHTENRDAAARRKATDDICNSRIHQRNAVKWNANNFYVSIFRMYLSGEANICNCSIRGLIKVLPNLPWSKEVNIMNMETKFYLTSTE